MDWETAQAASRLEWSKKMGVVVASLWAIDTQVFGRRGVRQRAIDIYLGCIYYNTPSHGLKSGRITR